MEKLKYRCRNCQAIIEGEDARLEHCKTHHPATSPRKLDVFLRLEFKELSDEPQIEQMRKPSFASTVANQSTFGEQPSGWSGIFEGNDNIPNWIKSQLSNNENIFITGKAGTGKTTLLKEIVNSMSQKGKLVAVLAPTGVAAKNASGQTIHSFLRLPITPYLPNAKIKDLYSLTLTIELKAVVRRIDAIIIDEISMVRCDLLDMIDDILRHYRNTDTLFGGIRIIAFGDLYQLMPVVTSKDWQFLKEWYRSPYFFSSKAYEDNPFRMISLTKVFRQSDSDFLDLLNEVRNGKISEKNLALLNKKYRESNRRKQLNGVIRITTHNKLAKSYNEEIFSRLPGRDYEYKASVSGYVHPLEYPTSGDLYLKIGARVMFIKNDTSSASQYVNGTLGTVVKCDDESVSVRLDDSGAILRVTSQAWYFDEYFYNRVTHSLELHHRGIFRQLPLKLAWAITIHKSQGLTFDKVVIDAGKAFASGQVYVALSRCRKLEGITLATPITPEVIQTDPIVKHFMNPEKDNEDLPAFTIKKKSGRKPKIPVNLHGLKLIKWLAEKDFTIEEMRAAAGYDRIELVYNDLCKLISDGKLGLACRMIPAKINNIKEAWERAGLDAELKEVKSLCNMNVRFGEIQMVRSYMEYMANRKK